MRERGKSKRRKFEAGQVYQRYQNNETIHPGLHHEDDDWEGLDED